jgi:hypothetical protein
LRKSQYTKGNIIAGILLSAGAAAAITTSTQAMSSKLIPPNPDEVMVIRDITPNVVTFSVPFLRFGRIPIGGRGTVSKS